VNDGSALKAGPISKTRSKPAAIASLFVELRRLGEEGGSVMEIIHLERLGPGLAEGAHQLWRVNFNKTLPSPELSHRVL
jgi:hypothetical protein